MRLFVSVGVEPLSDRIETVQEPLTGLEGLRPTDPGQAHVTVKFLGECDHDNGALEGAIGRAVAEAGVGSFEATLEGVGAFPSPEYIRVVWLGFGDGTEQLSELHRRVEAETTALGYDEERHAFTPHVTLARMDNAASKADIQRFLRERDPTAGTVEIEEIRLTESELTPESPDYRTVERFEL
ncbi:RNA 2',3'-cyclic phosphodiesterase [Natronomonas sp. F2-12]|jgi:2'-5' RNA ligase|uniref:RNA 2',3'-cyclic phosphodiesterase n=1 Tax=Natronomonas aquatica TaxID=2841590 RepID=A0A9R1CQC0_9EURY|nr:RNA 2',3'-cyclic phosphodiesterase [Natronomonas aquatica]MCQ4332015.1 RNA 2',3'-cyclic phosphodiesterase [Natronomonas aquatica]